MTTSLHGSRVLVTGATGGLGAPIVRLLAAKGALLTLVARNPERLTALAALVDRDGDQDANRGLGGGAPRAAVAAAVDLSEPAGPGAAVEAAVAQHGGLDGVVHAAGVVAFGLATEVDDATLTALFALNTLAPVRLLRAAFPHLQASAAAGRSPFVVHLSAVVVEQPVAGMAAYSASKAALASFDAAAGRELRRARIRLVDARPPHTETGLAGRAISGVAPALPQGLEPDAVAARIVAAIENDERDLPSSAFG